MLDRIIKFSLSHCLLIISLAMLISVYGVLTLLMISDLLPEAILAESSLSLQPQDTFSGRAEWVQKTPHDLIIEVAEDDEQKLDVGKLALGYSRETQPMGEWRPGFGIAADVNFYPKDL